MSPAWEPADMPSTGPRRLKTGSTMMTPPTTRSVALLRGINVGGHRTIKMNELRAWMLEVGFTDVETYLQSGNVLFAERGLDSPASTISKVIADCSGHNVDVFLRTSEQLDGILRSNPFPGAEATQLHVAFLNQADRLSFTNLPDESTWEPERFHAEQSEIYLYLPQGMGRAVLPRKLAVLKQSTMRNWKTVCQLAELARA